MTELDKRFFVPEGKGPKIEAPWTPVFDPLKEARRIMYLDKDIVPGAFYMECVWFWPGDWPSQKGVGSAPKPHTHPFGEVIGYFGTNPADPYDLGGEVEIWIDGKQNITNRTVMAFIPAGTVHCPIFIKRVDRPIFHITSGSSQTYY